MKKYKVISGSLNRWVMADSIEDAYSKAINKFNPKSLGIIMSIQIKNGEEIYISTERILAEMGTPLLK